MNYIFSPTIKAVSIFIILIIMTGCSKTSDLIDASKSGNITKVKEILEQGVNVNGKGFWSKSTALISATEYGYADIAKLLIDFGADVSIKNRYGHTPLRVAAEEGHADVANLLIDASADLNVRDYYSGYTLLMTVATKRQVNVTRLLIDAGADLGLKDDTSKSALMLVSDKGYADVIKLLIDAGADLDLKDDNGESALMLVSFHGYADVAKLLIDAGADVNLKGSYGQNALMKAYRSTDVAKLLIDAGADINARDNYGDSALMEASSYYGKTNVVKLLIDAGANVNAKDNYQDTPLMTAAKQGKFDIAKLLIDAGADINAKNKYGISALVKAARERHTDVANLLIVAGADTNAEVDKLVVNPASRKRWGRKGPRKQFQIDLAEKFERLMVMLKAFTPDMIEKEDLIEPRLRVASIISRFEAVLYHFQGVSLVFLEQGLGGYDEWGLELKADYQNNVSQVFQEIKRIKQDFQDNPKAFNTIAGGNTLVLTNEDKLFFLEGNEGYIIEKRLLGPDLDDWLNLIKRQIGLRKSL